MRRCGTCVFAKWPADKRGHVLRKGNVAKCEYPVPLLPASMRGGYLPKDGPGKRFMVDSGGEDCAVWVKDEE